LSRSQRKKVSNLKFYARVKEIPLKSHWMYFIITFLSSPL